MAQNANNLARTQFHRNILDGVNAAKTLANIFHFNNWCGRYHFTHSP